MKDGGDEDRSALVKVYVKLFFSASLTQRLRTSLQGSLTEGEGSVQLTSLYQLV